MTMMVVLLTVFWLMFGILLMADLHPAAPASANLRWLMAGLAVLTSLALTTLLLLLPRWRPAYFCLVTLLVLLSLLSITDEVGLFDWLSFGASLLPVVLLIKDARFYKSRVAAS